MGTVKQKGSAELTPAEAVALAKDLRAAGVSAFKFGAFEATLRPVMEYVGEPEKDDDTTENAKRLSVLLGSAGLS